MEMKCISNITWLEMMKMLIKKVIPAMKEKWPAGCKCCIIQQDNAKPHTSGADGAIAYALQHSGIDMTLSNQPPNSPDFNVNDLGFFNAIQSLQNQQSLKNIDDLVECVERAFAEMHWDKFNNVFLSYQLAMESAMKVSGGNNYKLQHIGKAKLQWEGWLSTSI